MIEINTTLEAASWPLDPDWASVGNSTLIGWTRSCQVPGRQKSPVWRQKRVSSDQQDFSHPNYRWTAMLGRKCVMVGNGDSMGFSHDGWVRTDLLSSVV